MRIGIDARYVYDHFPGIGRYVAELATALAELEHGHRLVLLYHPDLPAQRHNLAALAAHPQVELVPCRARPFSLAEHRLVPQIARRLSLDLFHAPYYVRPYFGLPKPTVMTVYDLIGWRFPEALSSRGRLLFRTTMGLAVRTSQALIAISESARDDLAFAYKLARERIRVTPLAASRHFQPAPRPAIVALRQRLGLPERYILYLGANKPHKNLERLLRAWERLQQEGQLGGAVLIIAGHEDRRYPTAHQFVAERNLASVVRFLPNVAEADLPALYSGAEAFAFPSFYEGFGLPPLEAMACGTPVLCAYASSLPEVVGNAAITVDPYSFLEIAEGLARLLNDPPLRRRLSEAGRQRARQFTWQRTAIETLSLYEALKAAR